MSDQIFRRLAPFIRDYIYAHNWTEMREIQTEACRIIFETDANLLLASGTASGKTEAAFLPIITLLHEQPSHSVGVLYIGPLKALINDQFIRLNDLLKEADIPVWPWHGDVSQNQKAKLLKNPQGVLQITPESLESLLINKHTELVRMFGDLKFIVIDEIHVFMGSDRGTQVQCQLERLQKYMRTNPRRVGLSATLGDYKQAEDWLCAGTNRSIIRPDAKNSTRAVRLSVEHFCGTDNSNLENQGKDDITAYERYIYEKSKARKCLVFANSRSEVETIGASLRQLAEREKAPDIFHVHHGSISAGLREAAESAMREPNIPAVTIATLTLELGIDIGALERVIQLGSPSSVSSFLQRLGRTGRRGTPSEMWFVSFESNRSEGELPEQFPWQLLQNIAMIQLYLEEKWIEPINPPKYPLSLLYHQTMSILVSSGELSPAALAQRVLTLSAFQGISIDDFRELLLYLISINHIEQTEERGLIVGLAGEKVVRDFRFYAVFPDNEEYIVREEAREIGSIVSPPPLGERFALAGLTWEVVEIDIKHKSVFVKRVKGKSKISWNGGGGKLHSKVLQRMRKVLEEDIEYIYLGNQAKKRLLQARELYRLSGLNKTNIVSLGGNSYCIFPWMGTVECRTLERGLKFISKERLGIKGVSGFTPYFMIIHSDKGNLELIKDEIAQLSRLVINPFDLVDPEEVPQLAKYDEFIPANLLRKTFALDYLDVQNMQKAMQKFFIE